MVLPWVHQVLDRIVDHKVPSVNELKGSDVVAKTVFIRSMFLVMSNAVRNTPVEIAFWLPVLLLKG